MRMNLEGNAKAHTEASAVFDSCQLSARNVYICIIIK